MDKVSIIIPCFNSAQFIEATILSVFQQKGFDLEIICVDNNSTDNTLNVLKELKAKYGFIKIEQEIKKGASQARTKGLQMATGKYVQFLDSDDIILPGKFAAQIKRIEELNLDWVISDRSVLSQDLSLVKRSHTYEKFMDNPLGMAIAQVITSGNPLYKREAVVSVGGYTPSLIVGQDWDFHLKLILKGTKFDYIAGDYFHSRDVEGSLSSNWFKVSKSLCLLIKSYKNSFVDNGILENAQALVKIHNIYFSTALSASEINLSRDCVKELSFWQQNVKLKKSLGGKSKILVSLFGISISIKLMRIFTIKLT